MPAGRTRSTPAESCTWLNSHHYNLESGNYWIEKQGGSSFQYCKMDEGGIPAPGASCEDLKKRHPHLRSGTYEIIVAGKTLEVECDMESDGGGWLMVGSAVVRT